MDGNMQVHGTIMVPNACIIQRSLHNRRFGMPAPQGMDINRVGLQYMYTSYLPTPNVMHPTSVPLQKRLYRHLTGLINISFSAFPACEFGSGGRGVEAEVTVDVGSSLLRVAI